MAALTQVLPQTCSPEGRSRKLGTHSHSAERKRKEIPRTLLLLNCFNPAAQPGKIQLRGVVGKPQNHERPKATFRKL
jgi:hypothetical protein